MYHSDGNRSKGMKRLKGWMSNSVFYNDSAFLGKSGLLRTGVISLLIHIALIVFLIPNLKPAITKGELSIYPVTLRAFPPRSDFSPHPARLPIPAKTQIQKEENKSIQEIKQRKPIPDKKNTDQEITSPAQAVITRILPEEGKQLPQHQEEEEIVKEPIPLPMAAASPLGTDLNLEMEDNLPVLLPASRLGEQFQNTISGTDSERGSGQGGSSWGSGDGSGAGHGGSGQGGSGKRAGVGQEGTARGGSGDGSGSGRRGSAGGGSGSGGFGGHHPRYAENPKPIYPREAQEKGYQGEVLLRVEVLSNGRVGQIEVKKSSGHVVLDQCALVTVKKWRFIPASKGGVAIPFEVNIPIKFELQ